MTDERPLPLGATGWAQYPTERFTLKSGFNFELEPLFAARGRIVSTDGTFNDAFW